jgi:hypothetical protein
MLQQRAAAMRSARSAETWIVGTATRNDLHRPAAVETRSSVGDRDRQGHRRNGETRDCIVQEVVGEAVI